MTWVDLAVLGVLLLSALLAFMRGLVREVLGLAAWIGAIFTGLWALPRIRPQFIEWLGPSPWIEPLAFASVFIVALVVLLLLARWISAFVRASPIGGLDRTLGLVFGLGRGAALVVLAYMIGQWVVHIDRWPGAVLEARSLPMAYEGAVWVAGKLPAEYRPQRISAPPDRHATAESLLQATPQGRAVGR
jgi:membrane protein required for colicin V production